MSVNTKEILPGQNFETVLARLRQRDVPVWTALVGRLRRVTLPWLLKRVGKLPPYALVSEPEFALEIFAESLSKFYDLLGKGTFEKESDLQSLMFKVSELKMKEAFARLRKEALIYRPADPEAFDAAVKPPGAWDAGDDLARERAVMLQRHFGRLEEDERSLLQRFYSGEKMSVMALELGTSEETLRKRKQRALNRLKQWMQLTINLVLFIWNL